MARERRLSVPAASRFADPATDPGAYGDAVVWHVPGAGGRIARSGGTVQALPGGDPAVGGGLVAWRDGDLIEVADVDTLVPRAAVHAPGAEELAVSAQALTWRDSEAGHGRLWVADPGGGSSRVVYHAPVADAHIGRPHLAGNVLVFHLATPRSSRIVELHLQTNRVRELVAPPGTHYLQPSIRGGAILLVRSTHRRQELLLVSRRTAKEQVLWSTEPTARRDAGREPGRRRHRHGYRGRRAPALWKRPRPGVVATLWTTALSADTAYVTRLLHQRGAPSRPEILVVPRSSDSRRERGARRWLTR